MDARFALAGPPAVQKIKKPESPMEFQQLKHFLAAVQYGNLARASEETHISQSGLSRSIKSLETRLGVPLLIRRNNGIEPTAYGLSMVERAKVILNEVSRSVELIRDLERAQVGEVTIGITNNFSFYLVPPVITRYMEQRPDVHVRVVVDSFPQLIERLKHGELDFAFGLLGPLDCTRELDIEEVCDSVSQVICRTGHPLAGRRDLGVAELSAARWAMFDSVSLQHKFAHFFMDAHQPVPTQLLTTNSIVVLKSVLATQDLLTVLPVDMVRAEIDQGIFTMLACESPAHRAHAGLITRRNQPLTSHTKQLIDHIRCAAAGAPCRQATEVPLPVKTDRGILEAA